MFVEWVLGWLVKTLCRQINICGESIGLGSRAHVNDGDGDDQVFSRCSRSWVESVGFVLYTCVVLGMELWSQGMLGKYSTTESHPPGQEYYVIKPLCLRHSIEMRTSLWGRVAGLHSPCCSLSLLSFGGSLHLKYILIPSLLSPVSWRLTNLQAKEKVKEPFAFVLSEAQVGQLGSLFDVKGGNTKKLRTIKPNWVASEAFCPHTEPSPRTPWPCRGFGCK